MQELRVRLGLRLRGCYRRRRGRRFRGSESSFAIGPSPRPFDPRSEAGVGVKRSCDGYDLTLNIKPNPYPSFHPTPISEPYHPGPSFLQVYKFFTSQRSSFRWPSVLPEYQCPDFIQPPSLPELMSVDRIWTVPRVVDFSCEHRTLRPVVIDPTVPELAGLTLSGSDIRAFASHPLACLGLLTYCATHTRADRGMPPVAGESSLGTECDPS